MSLDAGAYAAHIRAMTNAQLANECGARILGAAVMARFRAPLNDGSEDDRCDMLYAESVRRGNTDLYNRGFNSAALSQGHSGLCTEIKVPIGQGEPS